MCDWKSGRKSGIDLVTALMAVITGKVPKVGSAWKPGCPSKHNGRSVPAAPRARLYVMIDEAEYVVVTVQERDLM